VKDALTVTRSYLPYCERK